MKISTILAASALAFATSAMAAGSLWPGAGPDGHGSQILTGGYFYGYHDSADKGTSNFAWANGVDEYGAPIPDADGALPMRIKLYAGAPYPLAAMGVDFIKGGKDPVDLSSHTGLCATIATFQTGVKFELKSGAYGAGNYDTYSMAVPNTAGSYAVVNFEFSKLAQEGWGTVTPIADVTAAATAFAFNFKGSAGKEAQISVLQLGYDTECDGAGAAATNHSAVAVPARGPSSSVLSPIANTSLKAALSGRSLSFSGLGKKTMQVQVINLQGQVFNSASLTSAKSTLNLNNLTSGVYIVRAVGADFNFSQKIVLE